MKIDGIGEFKTVAGELYGPTMKFESLKLKYCFVLEEYDEDPNKDEFHSAMKNFSLNFEESLKEAKTHIYDYYLDLKGEYEDDEFMSEILPEIKSSEDVCKYIELGDEMRVGRRPYGDQKIYISIECGCDWEEEHGLQIVSKEGKFINKVGEYDGHHTNSDAYDNDSLESVVYKKMDTES